MEYWTCGTNTTGVVDRDKYKGVKETSDECYSF